MSAPAGSVGSLISALLLSDYRVLQSAWSTSFVRPLSWEGLRTQTYLAFQPWAARYPDHVFGSGWRALSEKERPNRSVLLAVLGALVDEYLLFKHGGIHVRGALFGAWQQSLISRISALPIVAMANTAFSLERHARSHLVEKAADLTTGMVSRWHRSTLVLLQPLEPVVNDYVMQEGLHETHLHLNGSTHAEICWLRAMRDPRTETARFVEEWKRGKHRHHIQDLVSQVNPDLTPLLLHQHLRAASRLRLWLISVAEHGIPLNTQFPVSCAAISTAGEEWSQGLRLELPSWRSEPNVTAELEWQSALIELLYLKPSLQLERMFHSYLLLQNQYYRLLVQSEAQYGFDQFQKLTLTELREPSERDYFHRFCAMHGNQAGTSSIGYLEGRFAPKNTLLKTYRLLHAILGGYLRYLLQVTDHHGVAREAPRSLSRVLAELEANFLERSSRHRGIHRLALVVHFIKQPWSSMPSHKAGLYRHYSLDLQLRRFVNVLLTAIRRWPRLGIWIRGIDAAANELHAPPDCFAPAFRVCRRAGLTHRSFHAGEDFVHLLTGLGYMWDTLNLLDLRDGDRIGHGTAMGIRPSLWLERMPSRLCVSRGDWLLGVLAAWQLLRESPAMQACAYKLQRELEETACEVFGTWLPASRIEHAMAYRGLCRQTLLKHFTDPQGSREESQSELWREEASLVHTALNKQAEDVELLWTWLSEPAVQKRADELIDKDAAFLDPAAYVQAQQALMRHVARRNVLIETLPSSNVRISQYRDFTEHHSLRWMRAPGHLQDGDPEIMISLGSDDPGIFAGDLKTEFHQLYAALRLTGLSDSEALDRLKVVNERGRIYRFHHDSLS